METEIVNVIERIYAAGAVRSRWDDLLEAIPDLVGCEAANLLVVRPKTRNMTVLSPRTDPAFVDAFFSEWWRHDPTYTHTLTAPVGQLVRLADTGRAAFLGSRFHNEFWKTSGHGADRLRANLIANPHIQIGFGVMPSARADEITREMHRVFEVLLPHMIRAVKMQWRIHRLETERAIAMTGHAVGVLVVNSAGRVLLADRAAEAALARGTQLTTRHGILETEAARTTDHLHRLIKSCLPQQNGWSLRGGTAELPGGDGPPLRLRVMPIPARPGRFGLDVDDNARPAALVVVEDAAARQQEHAGRLQASFGLTAKEALVALGCLEGGTRAQLAASLEVSDSTIRTHLTRIYEKTGTARKSELIGLLFQNGFGG